jgi:uncharacterized protein
MRIQTKIAAAAVAVAAVAMARPAMAQPTTAPAREQTIRVTGTGEARARPDQAVVDFAVETAAATAQAAASENAGVMERVIAALVRAGVPRDRIETSGYAVYPDYDPQPRPDQTVPTIRGYRVMNMVSVTLDDVDRVGAILDTALAAGANRVNGVRFAVRDPQAFRQRAIDDAVRRARADAQAIAAALGVELGGIREAFTADVGMAVPMYARAGYAELQEAAANTPVNPGEQTIRATVVLVYGMVH